MGLAGLAELDWPGSVREPSSFVERLVVFTDSHVITQENVGRELDRQPRRRPGAAASTSATGALGGRRDEAERSAVVEALDRAGGNRTKAARSLGFVRRALSDELADMNVAPAEA